MSWNQIQINQENPSSFTCIIDSRPALLFCDGFIPGSVHVPFSADFFTAAGKYLDEQTDWVWVCSAAQWKAVETQHPPLHAPAAVWVLSDEDPLPADWDRDMLIVIDQDEFEMDYRHDSFYLVDCREEEAFVEKHIEHAENLPLDDIDNRSMDLDNDYAYYVYGENQDAVITAGSVMKRNGLSQLRLVTTGWSDLQAGNFPMQKKSPHSSSPKP